MCAFKGDFLNNFVVVVVLGLNASHVDIFSSCLLGLGVGYLHIHSHMLLAAAKCILRLMPVDTNVCEWIFFFLFQPVRLSVSVNTMPVNTNVH